MSSTRFEDGKKLILPFNNTHAIVYNDIDGLIDIHDDDIDVQWYIEKDELINYVLDNMDSGNICTYDCDIYFDVMRYTRHYFQKNEYSVNDIFSLASRIINVMRNFDREKQYNKYRFTGYTMDDYKPYLFDDRKYEEILDLLDNYRPKNIKYVSNEYDYCLSKELDPKNNYYLLNKNRLIATILPYDILPYFIDTYDLSDNITYEKMKKIKKRYLKLPFINTYSILINRKKLLNNSDIVDKIISDNINIFYHGTSNTSMVKIINNGIKYNTTTKHGKRKGKGFYTSKRLDIANIYANSATAKEKALIESSETDDFENTNNLRKPKITPTIIVFEAEEDVNYDQYLHPKSRGANEFYEYVFRITSIIDRSVKPLYMLVNSDMKVNS